MTKTTKKHRKKNFLKNSSLILFAAILLHILPGIVTAKSGDSKQLNSVKVTVKAVDQILPDILRQIEKQTEFRFSFSTDINSIRTSIDVKKERLDYVLDELSTKGGVSFKQINSMIGVSIVTKQPRADLKIIGRVLDENGLPLPGATIYIKGSTTGTVSDADGNFSLTVPENSILVFSFLGYKPEEILIRDETSLSVKMTLDINSLNEIVVIGYGTQERSAVTSAISSIRASAIKDLPVSNSVSAMQGQLAGIDIQSNGGRPGEGPSILIRGRRSLTASNQPLFVVDGVPLVSDRNAFDINPNDIASIDVLKDAAATSIYGSRGANGVILISTKRGSSKKLSINYDGYYGVSSLVKKIDMMNGEEFADYKREAHRSAYNGTIPSDEIVFDDTRELESIALGRSTDYQDLIFDNGHLQNHQISLNGGNEDTKFFSSFNFYDEQGIVSTQDYKRYAFRFNIDQKIRKWMTVGTSTYLKRSVNNYGNLNVVDEALQNNPLGKPFKDDGTLDFRPYNDALRSNPLSEILPNAYVNERVFNGLISSVYANIDMGEKLTYRMTFAPELNFTRTGIFSDRETYARQGADPAAEKENREEFSFTLENLLTYSMLKGPTHQLNFSALQSIQKWKEETTFLSVIGLPYSEQLFNNLGSGGTIRGYDSNIAEWSIASFMVRANYAFKDKYLLQASIRTDGSSRLAEGKKWDYFPGISMGWRLSDEKFFQPLLKTIDALKLRASYGIVGNTAINPYQTQGVLARTPYSFGDNVAYGYRADQLANPLLGWEKTATLDIGADFQFMRGRLSGSIEWYESITSDLILSKSLPPTSGYQKILTNVGKTQNRGIEIDIRAVNIDKGASGFKWVTGVNFTRRKEQILSLFDGISDDIGNQWFKGHPVRVFYDYEKIGIWQLGEETLAASYGQLPGQIKVLDWKGEDGVPDGKISPLDRKIIGSDVPKFTFGITNQFNYKNFDASFIVFARVGHKVRSTIHRHYNRSFARYNNINVDYWTIDNPTNAYPRPNDNGLDPLYVLSMQYFDGSFVKIRNFTLGYSLPSSWTSKAKLDRGRFYISAQNPFYWSRFDTFDPESEGDVDADVPSTRSFIVGLNLTF